MHAATSKVENSAQGSSCKLKFVHGHILVFFSQEIIKSCSEKFDKMKSLLRNMKEKARNTKGGSITEQLTSCLIGLL